MKLLAFRGGGKWDLDRRFVSGEIFQPRTTATCVALDRNYNGVDYFSKDDSIAMSFTVT